MSPASTTVGVTWGRLTATGPATAGEPRAGPKPLLPHHYGLVVKQRFKGLQLVPCHYMGTLGLQAPATENVPSTGSAMSALYSGPWLPDMEVPLEFQQC